MVNWLSFSRPINKLFGQNQYDQDLYAAIDLGSNSFHAIIARKNGDALLIQDRLKETVRLAAGLNERDELDPDVASFALSCLERISQRLKSVPPKNIRAVGTNTLRRADNANNFLAQAEAALGTEIEVISGYEEARLIYQGVCRDLSHAEPRRLVVDIGGGSTELIYGEGAQALDVNSRQIGCVALSSRYFKAGNISVDNFKRATMAARLALKPIQRAWRSYPWALVLGASGTANAISSVLAAMEISDGRITASGLAQLETACLKYQNTAELDLPGLSEDRRPVFPAGLAAMRAVFAALNIEQMDIAHTALREGLLYDLIGSDNAAKVRADSVAKLSERYHSEPEQAERVRSTAMYLLNACQNSWSLDGNKNQNLLTDAALLHEVGLGISHPRYHRHGEYILRESDLPGFSQLEQQRLSWLIRYHRRSLPSNTIEGVSELRAWQLGRLLILLRIAVLLHRSRSPEPLPEIQVSALDEGLKLNFPEGWLAEAPLTEADLAVEASKLAAVGFALSYE